MSTTAVIPGERSIKAIVVTWIRVPLGVLAFIYGVIAVFRSAQGCASLADSALAPARVEATWHVLLWTFGPALWFALETWALKGVVDSQALDSGQKQISAIWAATLAAILFLVKP